MSKINVTFGVIGVLALVGALTVTVGSGITVTETTSLQGIEEIRLQGQGQIYLRQGETESLRIEAEDNIMPMIETIASGKSLKLKLNAGLFRSVIPRKGIKYYITLKKPRQVVISGSASLNAESISVDEFTTRINGSSKCRINNINANRILSVINGTGDFYVSGNVLEQGVDISGSGNYRGRDLVSDAARVEISGSGKTTIHAIAKLDVKISGSGKVIYHGSPSINQKVSGSGSITSGDGWNPNYN